MSSECDEPLPVAPRGGLKSEHTDRVDVFFLARPASIRFMVVGLVASQGKLEEAGPLYTRSLIIRESVLGLDHPSVATSLNNRAGWLQATVRCIEAENQPVRLVSAD